MDEQILRELRALGYLGGDVESGVKRGLAMAALKLGMYGDQLRAGPEDVARLLDGSHREVER